MRILLTGSNGQVGWELKRSLQPLGEVTAFNRQQLDLSDEQAIRQAVQDCQPHLIVNAAAYTAVDKAESEPELAHAINGIAPGILAEEAAKLGAWIVHYSTDYVYPGSGEVPYREDAKTDPQSTYGVSKLAGDIAVQQANPKHLIFRTSWVYSARGNNFVKTMLRLAAERDALSVVADQIGAPTSARLIADVSAQAIAKALQAPGISGVFHLVPRGYTSWHGFTQEIVSKALAAGVTLQLTPDEIAPIPTADYPTPATRPLNSRMVVDKLEKAFQLQLPEWQDSLALVLEELHAHAT